MKKQLLLLGIVLVNTLLKAQTPTFQALVQNTTGTQANEIISVAKDNNGNTFFCGTHSDAFTLGDKSLPSGQGGAFWGKADEAGNIVWLKQGGTQSPASDIANSIAVDKNGNVYVCGAIAGFQIANFNGVPLPSTFNGFVVKYSNDGSFIWATGLGLNANSIAVDNTNTPIINFGDQGVYKLNPTTGEFIESTSGAISGNLQNSKWHNIVIDASNNIIVQAGNKIVKFDTNFNQLWSTPVSGSLIETFRISLDQSGNVYGTFYGLFGTVTVGSVSKSNFPNGYIYKLDANTGMPLFVDAFLIGGNASKIKEVIVSGDNYYISGDGAFNTAVVLKTTATYSLLWQKNLTNKSPLNDIAFNAEDCLVLAGRHQGTVALDSNNLVPPSGMNNATSNSFIGNLCDGTLGLTKAIGDSKDLQLFPNPSNGNFTIQTTIGNLGSKVTIYTILGQKVKQFTIENTITNQGLNKGIYVLEIGKEGSKMIKKLIVN